MRTASSLTIDALLKARRALDDNDVAQVESMFMIEDLSCGHMICIPHGKPRKDGWIVKDGNGCSPLKQCCAAALDAKWGAHAA